MTNLADMFKGRRDGRARVFKLVVRSHREECLDIGLTSKFTHSFSNQPRRNSNIRDHDHHGPAGPTAFWKVSNDITTDMEKDFGDGHGVEAEAEVDVDDEEDTEYEGEEIHIEQLSVQQIAAVLGSLAGAHT